MQNKNLSLLWTGKLVSSIGDKLYAIAIAWWILEVTNSTVIMGLYLLTATLPIVIIGIIAGAIVDKSDLKHLMVITDVIRGICILLVGVLLLTGNLTVPIVFVITILISITSAFFNPSVTTIIPHIVPQDECRKANSIIQMVDGVAKLLGPIIGVVAVANIGYFGAFTINGLSFLISAFFEGFIEYKKESTKNSKMSLKDLKLIEEIKVGLLYVRSNSKLKNILFYIFVAHLFYSSVVVMMPFMAKFISNDNLGLLGILETVFGAGFIIGAYLLSKIKGSNFTPNSFPKIFVLTGFSIIALGWISNIDKLPLILTTIPIFVIGVCIVIASIIWQTFLQTDTPIEKLGRVSSISAMIGDITMPIGFALYGILLDKIDFLTLTSTSGILLILSVLIIKKIHVEDVVKI